MATATLSTARLVFEEQIAAFAQKLSLIGTQRFDDLRAEEHYRAFTVAGAMKADLLADLHESVRKTVVDGGTIQDFRKDFFAIAEKHGWRGWAGEGTAHGEAWRTRVIYQTNTRKAYSAGRYAQLKDPDMLAVRPYWRWRHSGLSKDPRPEHLAWSDAGLTLPHDHPFWATYFPPRIPPDYGCKCYVEAVRAPKDGDATEPPAGWESDADPGAGAPPQDVLDDIRTFVEEKKAKLPADLARDFGAMVEQFEFPVSPRNAIASRPAASGPSAAAAFGAVPAPVPAASTYDAARSGGPHAGLLRRYENDPDHLLEKAIRSYERRIAEHEQWIDNPYSKLPVQIAPDAALRYQTEKWPSDIKRLRQQAEILRGILNERRPN